MGALDFFIGLWGDVHFEGLKTLNLDFIFISYFIL